MRRLRHQVVTLVLSGLLVGVAAASDVVSVGHQQTWVLNHHGHRVLGTAFSPDGEILAVDTTNDATLYFWGTSNGKLLQAIDHSPDVLGPKVFSDDGKRFTAGTTTGVARTWDVATGEELYSLSSSGWVIELAFSPDERLLATSTTNAEEGVDIIRIWDLTSRKCTCLLTQGGKTPCEYLCFSPSGRFLLSSYFIFGSGRKMVRLWEVATGKLIRELDTGDAATLQAAFAANGETVICQSDPAGTCQVRFWPGEEVLRLTGHQKQIYYMLLLSGSHQLLTWDQGSTVRLWDTATGEEIHRLQRLEDKKELYWVGGDVSNDGMLIAWVGSENVRLCPTGFRDHQVADFTSLWRQTRKEPVPLRPEEGDALCSDLLSADASRAYTAICRLARSPTQSLKLLQSRLLPVRGVSQEHLAHLIADLDKDSFDTRNKANRELEQLYDLAEATLHNALTARPSAETRRRIEQLLEKIHDAVPPAETVRQLRALEVLERIGTPEAREILYKIANGAEQARVTREAKASLERLAKQAAGTR